MNPKVIFIIAFVAVLIGIYGIADTLLSSNTPTPQLQTPVQSSPILAKKQQSFTVWRAKQDLRRGEPISLDKLSRELVEAEQAFSLGVKRDVKLDFDPTVLLTSDIKMGELVFSEHQISPSDASYVKFLTRPDRVLYPLTIATKNLINNYIQPGDRIDIMAVTSPKQSLANPVKAITQFKGVKASLLMQHIRVVSIDASTIAQLTKTETKAKQAKENNHETTIVIEIKPDDIAKLSLAQRTIYLEIYPSQSYGRRPAVKMSDIIENYSGIVELRGAKQASYNEVLF